MSQGMFSSVTGIRANQTRLDVISDNIANINTVAFKASMANFGTVFCRTQSGGSAPVGNLGGTNPQQIGLGVKVSEIGRDFAAGNVLTTGRSTDLNIQGEGFFVLENGGAAIGPTSGVVLTRAGNFTLDANGIMVNPTGLRVIGTDDVSSTTTTTTQYVQVPRVLNLTKTVVAGVVTAVDILAQQSNTSDYTLTTFSIASDGAVEATYSNGDRITVRTDGLGTNRELIYFPAEGGSGLTGAAITQSGGVVVNAYQLQIQFATVTNNAGLVASGNNLFTTGVNSGSPTYSIGRSSGVGLIDSGGLETSNVDLTREFSLMMLSQRALEACSRAFDANNSVLQTIVNMAR